MPLEYQTLLVASGQNESAPETGTLPNFNRSEPQAATLVGLTSRSLLELVIGIARGFIASGPSQQARSRRRRCSGSASSCHSPWAIRHIRLALGRSWRGYKSWDISTAATFGSNTAQAQGTATRFVSLLKSPCCLLSASHLDRCGQVIACPKRCPKNGDVPKSLLCPIGSLGAVGRHNIYSS